MKSTIIRYSAAAFGAALLVLAGSAMASAEEFGEEGVDVLVTITELEEPGTLALTVSDNSTTLTESGSTEAIRQFTGVLPNVTVTDTRTADEIPDGANWYVLGTASDFETTTGETIGAEHFGWSPQYVGGSDEGDGVVSVGGDVGTVLDGEPGLVDLELLYMAFDVPSVDGGGLWTASADLFLRVNSGVTPGSYQSVITLSLFE